MNAMLLLIFVCAASGLLAARVGRRAFIVVPIAATALTLTYLVYPRYM